MSEQSELEATAVPALFHHCARAYEVMFSEASEVKFDDITSGIVYEGHLTTLIKDKVNLSVPYYSSVTRALKKMECIRQLRRGGGNSPSQWELIREPTEELFREAGLKEKTNQARYVTQGELAAVQQQVKDQSGRLNSLEESLDRIVEGLQ